MLELTDQNFEKEVLQSDVPVLVDFWAPWCGPCQKMRPVVEALAGELSDVSVKIGTLNVDEHGATAQRYGVLSIPTFFVFKNGHVAGQLIGVQSKEKLKAALMV